jgi:hypothetical protein
MLKHSYRDVLAQQQIHLNKQGSLCEKDLKETAIKTRIMS